MANKQFLDKQGLTYFYNQLQERLVGKKTTEGGEIFNDYVNNKATAQYSTTMGSQNSAEAKFSIAAGNLNRISSDALESMTIGDYNYVTGASSFIAGCNNYCNGGNHVMAGMLNYVDYLAYYNSPGTNSFVTGTGNFTNGSFTVGDGIINFGGYAFGVSTYPKYYTLNKEKSSVNKSTKTFTLVLNKTGDQGIKPGWYMAVKGQIFKIASCSFASATNTYTIITEETPRFDALNSDFDNIDPNSSFFIIFNSGEYYIEGSCNFANGGANKIYNADGYVPGQGTTTGRATYNFINGYNNSIINGANGSSIFGIGLNITNSYETAFGYYNKSTEGKTVLSVGLGSSSNRKNIFEIQRDGSAFINNVKISTEGHTHQNATTSVSGFMSASDKTKLDGLTKITVDASLSSTSTNPVQNNVINTALSSKLTKTQADSYYQPKGSYLTSIPTATDSNKGGFYTGYVENGYNYPVDIDLNGKAFVNVPWTDTTYSNATSSSNGLMSSADKTKLDGLTNYTLPTATATVKGGIELFSNTVQSVAANTVTSTASRTYGIQLNSAGQAVVNVPWTNTTYSVATISTNGLMSSTDKSAFEDLKNIQILGSGDGIPTSVQEDSNNNLYFNLPITSYVSNSGWSESDTPAKYIIPVAEPYTGLTGTGKSGIVTKEDKNAIEKIKKENLLTTDTTISYYLNKLYFIPRSITPGSTSDPQLNRIQIPEASATQNGLMSASDKSKLNEIQSTTLIKGIIILSLEDYVRILGVYDGYGKSISNSISATSLTATGFTLNNIPTSLQPSAINKPGQVQISPISGNNWIDGDGYIDVYAQGRFVSSKSSLKIALKASSNTSQSGLIITIYNI